MKSAYAWLLRGFLTAFGLLIVTQLLLMVLGIAPVLEGYARSQGRYLEDLARRILINPATVDIEVPQHSGPFFVFSADKSLLYSNRGRGRSIPETDYRPIRYGEAIIGYYYAGEIRFLDSHANRVFLASLGILVAGSMVVSLLIALATAIRAARAIAEPVAQLNKDILILRDLRPVEKRVFAVNELTEISESLHEVSTVLAGEEEYKRQWMQNIAHDLRTPISGLKGQLEGMRDGVLEPTAARFEKNLVEITRLEELAGSISELYTLENMKEIKRDLIDAAGFAEELRASFEVAMEQKQMTFVSEVLTPTLSANRALLARAAGNILTNAINYAGRGANVSLTISYFDGKTILRIANTGPRIPENQLDKIFQRFYRGEGSRTTRGTGLGLNIASEITLRHGGTLTVRNLDPEGVEFTIQLRD